MGGNVSREVTITDEKTEKTSTLPASFRGLGDKVNWSGTFPRGLNLESNHSFSIKLTKSKKYEVTPTKTENTDDKGVAEEDEVEEKTVKDFIEALLLEVIEDSMEGISELEKSKSSTLPATIKGLGLNRNQSFGKRMRKSIRKLVVKTPKKNKNGTSKDSTDLVESLLSDVLLEVTVCDEKPDKGPEESLNVTEGDGLEDIDLTGEAMEGISELETSKSSTLPASFRGLSLNRNQSFGKSIRNTIRNFVVKTPKKSKDEEGMCKDNSESLGGEVTADVAGVMECNEEPENGDKLEKQDLVESKSSLEIKNEVADAQVKENMVDATIVSNAVADSESNAKQTDEPEKAMEEKTTHQENSEKEEVNDEVNSTLENTNEVAEGQVKENREDETKELDAVADIEANDKKTDEPEKVNDEKKTQQEETEKVEVNDESLNLNKVEDTSTTDMDPLKCEKCDYKAKNRKALKGHIKKKHGKDSNDKEATS